VQIGEVLERLQGVKKCGAQWIARCPAHDDHAPSLSILDGDKGIVFKCHTGCSAECICQSLGVEFRDLFHDSLDPVQKPRPQPAFESQIKSIYCYRDENDEPLYRVIRYEPKDFRVQHPLSKDPGNDWSKWAWGLNGQRRVPYHLSKVLAAIKQNLTVFVVEGEKDVQTLEHRGLVGTTNAGGAGKWDDSHSGFLAGASVVVLPDRDEPGRRHADSVAASLENHARSVRILELPRGKDVTEWFDTGGTPEELELLIRDARAFGFELVSDHELLNKPQSIIRWAVPDLLPQGLAMLAGAPKAGKSFLAMNLAGAVGGGGTALGAIPVHKGSAVYFALEDTESRTKWRREVMFGPEPLHGFYVRNRMPKWKDREWDLFEKWLVKNPDCRLVIVDTLVDIKPDPGTKTGFNAYESDAVWASEVKQLADGTGICLLLVHHLNKMDQISGTQGIPAKCDTLLQFRRDRDDETVGVLKVKGREVEERTMNLYFNKDTYVWSTVQGYGAAEEPSGVRKIVVDLVYRSAHPVSIELIRQELDDRGHKTSRESAKQLLWRLVRQGVVERFCSGVYCTPRQNDVCVTDALPKDV
jgi:hypothetical protein